MASNQFGGLSELVGVKTTIPQQVTEVLRGLIVSGDLPAGERIVESRIAKELGVGHPTVREALIALEHQGLVVRRQNQGCSVTELTPDEIDQISQVRLVLEPLAAELAAGRATKVDTAAFRSALCEMKAAAEREDIEGFYRHDLQFHEELWKLAANPYLEKALSFMIVPLLAFGMLKSLREHAEIDLLATTVMKNHERIADAILCGDADRARDTTREVNAWASSQHIRRARS